MAGTYDAAAPTPETGELAAEVAETRTLAAVAPPAVEGAGLGRLAFVIAMGWAGTNIGLNVSTLPLKFLLKDGLHLTAAGVSAFFALSQFSNYIKPCAGILTDAIPLFGTRRRHYLGLSLLGTGLLFLLLGVVPRSYQWIFWTYTLLYITVVFTSTTLGGTMVEVGNRFQAAGRLTAQRIAMFRVGTLIGVPLGGRMAEAFPFPAAMVVSGLFHLILVPLFYRELKEPPAAKVRREVLADAGMQLRKLVGSRILWSAAGMICLIAAAPGFGTPLFFHQTDVLGFKGSVIGLLELVGAAFGLLGACLYYVGCRRLNLRMLLAWSIVVHALGTIFYLWYHDLTSALVITAISGVSGTLAMLPVYDLACRGTPRGCEALGYSVMMSVWNLTNALSDWIGSQLFTNFHLTFKHLVWVNAGTTAIVLIAVPLLPQALLMRKDGMPDPEEADPALETD